MYHLNTITCVYLRTFSSQEHKDTSRCNVNSRNQIKTCMQSALAVAKAGETAAPVNAFARMQQ